MLNSCKTIHLVGILSSGGVHRHQNHLFQLIDILNQNNKEVLPHCSLDGRDSSPTSGQENMNFLLEKIKDKKQISIASVCGRFSHG